MARTMTNVRERQELGDFLRSRRARLDPEATGLPQTLRRRTVGLRREEVAQLAGMSTDWYTRLEQGRDIHPSSSVLEALARALQLDANERDHLFTLAGGEPPRRLTPTEECIEPGLALVLAVLKVPAFILGRRWDVLAWNDAAARVIVDFAAFPQEERNMLRLMFLQASTRELYADWERAARETAATFRATASRYLEDPAVIGLIEELSLHSPDFRRLWRKHEVQEKTSGVKSIQNPTVGLLHLRYQALRGSEDSDQRLVIYMAEQGTDSACKLERLLR